MHPNICIPGNTVTAATAIAPADSVAIDIRMIPDSGTVELCRSKYNEYTRERYKEMINRRHILGHLNRWNRIVAITLYACGAVIAFIAGAMDLWILSIISGSISVLGGVFDMIQKESAEACNTLDKMLTSLDKYYPEYKNNDTNRRIAPVPFSDYHSPLPSPTAVAAMSTSVPNTLTPHFASFPSPGFPSPLPRNSSSHLVLDLRPSGISAPPGP